ncbi:MAG: T9SS type A sorting domain-containing protein [Syntrophothermus sp.]
MKKIYMLLFLFLMASGAFAQCFIYEGFDNGVMPPTGWTIDGIPDQWTVGNSDNAGGTMPEGQFSYVQGTYTTRLITPMMDLTGLTSVKLSFRHMYDWYANPAPKVGVATRSHNGTWNSVWEVTPTANINAQLKEITITNTDVGQSEFQFCFYLTGNMYNLDYWYVDNILFYNALQTNGTMLSISTPKYVADPVPVSGTLMNTGTDPITSLELAWKLDNATDFHTSTFTGLNVVTEASIEFIMDLLNPPIGEHDLKVWISKVNGSPDNDPGDDTLVKHIVKVCHAIPRLPVFEEFTSSTCAPCASFNSGFVPWCNTQDSAIGLIKYQMNWPGNGDPYYTEEGGVRRGFYGVGFVPDLYCNGGNVATDMSAVQNAFDAAQLKPGLLDIATSYTLTNKVITINSSVLPFANFENTMVQIGVFEEVTYNNVATNGETEFEHVMMKMVPDAYGTISNFTDRAPISINQTVDLSTTNIERWDDVSVIVFVQDMGTREIYQTGYAKMDAQFRTEARLSDLKVDGTTIANFNSDTYDYTVEVPSGTVVAPVVTGIPIDPTALAIVVPATTIPGTTVVDVFAQDRSTKKTYNVNFDWYSGNVEKQAPAVLVYPNPTHGMVTISGATGAGISVMDANGRMLQSISNFTGTSIDLTGYPKGVYLLNITVAGKNPVHQRVVVY